MKFHQYSIYTTLFLLLLKVILNIRTVWHVDQPTHQIDWCVDANYVRLLNFISMFFLADYFCSEWNISSHNQGSPFSKSALNILKDVDFQDFQGSKVFCIFIHTAFWVKCELWCYESFHVYLCNFHIKIVYFSALSTKTQPTLLLLTTLLLVSIRPKGLRPSPYASYITKSTKDFGLGLGLVSKCEVSFSL